MKEAKILVAGSFVMDLIVSAQRFPSSGETVLGTDFRQAPGGKGANQAVQAARLGASVDMFGKIGGDSNGEKILETLKESKVDISKVIIDKNTFAAVGNVQLEVGPDGTNNRIIVVPGANMKITKEEAETLKTEIAKYDMVILQLEIPMEVNETIAKLAHEAGVPVMLNPAPYDKLSPDFLKNLTYISPNEHEAAGIVGFEVDSEEKVMKAAKTLIDMGVENVIITLGSRGAAFANKSEFFIAESVKGVVSVDPTAAGDSFIGAFCTAICQGKSPEDAMTFANKVAAITVTRYGAMPSLPYINEV